MKSFLLLAIFFVIWTLKGFSQITNSGTAIIASNDTSKVIFKSGFYFAVPDSSMSLGFPLSNSNEYYFLKTEDGVTLDNIDTVYKEFNSNYNLYVLTFKFNEAGTKELLDFTMKYQGWKLVCYLTQILFTWRQLHRQSVAAL
jgi:preprotein translocase subunit SecD